MLETCLLPVACDFNRRQSPFWTNIVRDHTVRKNRLANVRWRLVLQVGLIVVIFSNLLLLFLLGAYTLIFWLLNAARQAGLVGAWAPAVQGNVLQLFAQFFIQVADWGLPAVTILVTAGAAARVAHEVEASARLHGALVGLIAALSGWAVNAALYAGPSSDFYLRSISLFLLTVAAGWLGSVPVHLEQAKAEALYRASRAIRGADTLQAIVAAIGENLAGPDVHAVALWRLRAAGNGALRELVLLASWTPPEETPWPAGLRLDVEQDVPSLADFRDGVPWMLGADDVGEAERAVWQRLGVRYALLLPVNSGIQDGAGANGEPERGLIMVASSSPLPFGEERLRTYLTVDAQVELMLENLRLVEKARQAGVSEERQRLAHEIHDTLAQGFTSIVMHMEAAEQALAAEPEKARHHVTMARQTARENLSQARRLVWALRPKALEKASLAEAVNRVVSRWSEASGVESETVITGNVASLHPSVEIVLLRAVQEALANVRKHAHAGRVIVTLSYVGDLVLLDVQDDGAGFDPAVAAAAENEPDGGGYGLRTMRERCEQLGGELSIESEPGQGTTIALSIPIAGRRQADARLAVSEWMQEGAEPWTK